MATDGMLSDANSQPELTQQIRALRFVSSTPVGLTLKRLPIQFLSGFIGIGLVFVEYIFLTRLSYKKSLTERFW